MAGKLKIEFISEGFTSILTSGGTQSLVEGAASNIASRCGDGYESSSFVGGFGKGRHVGLVRAATLDAMIDEAENKTLEKAVNG